ncbi:hypothetical protein J9S84_004803 [Salmonella enterica]|uniref:hypothetical protein n=1 Tax=Salmonella enterica TaxID=28901 RepID=UPI00122E61AA|nr:hypothetical protein [Salmonella enterica]EBE2904374.1 hypothetical protein [Salmonella enterica subsp. enterica serovar Krefeld]EBW9749019.1 hypothetical protein [Salmonella enterica subsp. enterica serovar Kingston]EDQ2562680.1 hypothetical protein [Salmonella enterica subsp. enterica serovar Langensalza]EDT5369879.1 hypothetical protein [Salmonella enterica subsp. enterica]EAY9606484.1 hypothetical protein [Salmonella enterica]
MNMRETRFNVVEEFMNNIDFNYIEYRSLSSAIRRITNLLSRYGNSLDDYERDVLELATDLLTILVDIKSQGMTV